MKSWALSFCKLFCSAFIILGVLEFSAQATTQSSLMSTEASADLFRVQISTGAVIFDTLQGTRLRSAVQLPSTQAAHGRLIGATVSNTGVTRLVYFNNSTGALSVSVYGGANHETFLGSSQLTTLSAGWAARAIADFNHDGSFGVIATDASNGDVEVYSFGGAQATSLLKKEAINGLSVSGYNVFGAADLNGDGHADLLLQNRSTQQVMVAYLGGANRISVLSTHNLESSTFVGWTAAGMEDMNGDGHPDLILVNNKTGESIVNFYGGEMGFGYIGSAYLDPAASRDWAIVVPVKTAPTNTGSSTALTTLAATSVSTPTALATSTSFAPQATTTSAATVLIYNGLGTSSGDVAAVESLVTSMGLSYQTANNSQLNGMSEAQLLAYRLFLMPGGNAISISSYLSRTTTANLHNAIAAGLNYLGFCAGGFFAGSSAYHNYTNLTNGVWFNVYPNYGRGIGKAVIRTSFPNGSTMDMYWQDGPALDKWGAVVARYPDGNTAITEGFEGNGFVLLCGLHPEAPASWRIGMNFSTPLDVDLAFARSLVTSALNRSMLPHY